MSDFALEVYDVVKRIPKGSVASYSDVAKMAGRVGAARAVGNILHKNPWPDSVPCYKVVHSDGRLSDAFAFGGLNEQKARLQSDGIEVFKNKVDMKKYRIRL